MHANANEVLTCTHSYVYVYVYVAERCPLDLHLYLQQSPALHSVDLYSYMSVVAPGAARLVVRLVVSVRATSEPNLHVLSSPLCCPLGPTALKFVWWPMRARRT